MKKILVALLIVLINSSGSVASKADDVQCEPGKCTGRIDSSHAVILAKDIVRALIKISPEKMNVSCNENRPRYWECLVKQIPNEGEALPPGRYWIVSLDFQSGEYEILMGF